MTSTTKIVLAIILVAILGAIAFGIYLYLVNPSGSTTGSPRSFLFFPGGGGIFGSGTDVPADGTGPPGNNGGEEQPQNTRQIIKEPAIGAILAKDELKILYYKRAGGNLFRADLDGGNEENLSNLTIIGLTDVRWSPSRNEAALAYIDEGVLRYLIENVATATTVFLPQRVTSADWEPGSGGRLAYTEISGSTLRVVMTNSRLKNPQTIFTNAIPDYRISWVDKSTLIAATSPTYAIAGLSSLITPDRQVTEFIFARGLGLLASPGGGILALSSVDENGRLRPIRFIDKKAADVGTSGVYTLVEKCAWDAAGALLFCAVPQNPTGLLPDDWYKGEVSFNDRFVKIDTRAGTAVDLPTGEGNSFDATHLFLDSKSKYLFFTNKIDSTLWRIELE